MSYYVFLMNIKFVFLDVLLMSNDIVEIFLFIDPLGKRCNNARKMVKKLREEQIDRIRVRVIPMVNTKKVFGYARKQVKSEIECFVARNNHYSTNTYQASLAFYASTMQGRKYGDKLLSALQYAVVEEKQDYSESLVFKIAEKMESFDLEMFKEDYQSELAKNIYRRNLMLAAEMNVNKTPSCVIFKNGTENEAIRLDKEIESKILRAICDINEAGPLKDEDHENNENKVIQNILNLNIF